MTHEGLSEIIRSAIDAAIRPQEWERVCDLIVSHCRLNAFFLYEYSLDAGAIPSMYVSDAIRRNGNALLTTLRSGQGGTVEQELYASTTTLEPCRIVFEHETMSLASEEQLPTNPFRDGILAASNSRRRFGARLNDIGPFVDIGSGHTDRSIDSFSTNEVLDLQLIFNVLGKSFETGRVIRQLTRTYQALLDFFDTVDFGAAFCDASCRIVIANRRLRELAAERDGLIDQSGSLFTTSTDDDARFRDIVKTACRPGSTPDNLIMGLRRRSRRLPLVARTMAVREPQTGVSGPLALVLVIDPEGRQSLDSTGIAAFGMLSPAELDVCDHLIKGAGTVEIAERRSTTTETTRGQIKTISAKLACRNRLDLIRLAMMTSAPVKGLDTP